MSNFLKFNKQGNLKIILDPKQNNLSVEGRHGILSKTWDRNYVNIISTNEVFFKEKKFLNMFKSHLSNMVRGVKQGFFLELELVGLGYRVFYLNDKKSIGLDLGYSHILELKIPSNLDVKCTGSNIMIWGIDKDLVHSFAAKIYHIKKRDPYKGKGFRFKGEVVKTKVRK